MEGKDDIRSPEVEGMVGSPVEGRDDNLVVEDPEGRVGISAGVVGMDSDNMVAGKVVQLGFRMVHYFG